MKKSDLSFAIVIFLILAITAPALVSCSVVSAKEEKVIDKIQIQTPGGSVVLINCTSEKDWRAETDENCIYLYVKIKSATTYLSVPIVRILYEDSTGEHSIDTGVENVVVYYRRGGNL